MTTGFFPRDFKNKNNTVLRFAVILSFFGFLVILYSSFVNPLWLIPRDSTVHGNTPGEGPVTFEGESSLIFSSLRI